jgi:alpha/beta superfamily hydrolase
MMGDAGFLGVGGKPRLFVQGANDQFGNEATMRALVEPLPEPRTLAVVPGADHFFSGHLEQLQEIVASWIAGRPWEAS